MNLTSTGKKFSCVTSAKHYDAFREMLPDGTRFLVDENPDIRAFLKQGIPLRTDVAVVDEAGFCAAGSDENCKDLLVFPQDLADAGAAMQVILIASSARQKGDRWISQLIDRGVTDIVDPEKSYDLAGAIADHVERPRTAEDMEGGYRAGEKTGFWANREKKKRAKAKAKAAKKGIEVAEEAPNIAQQMESSNGSLRDSAALMSGPSATQLARERLHDSGKLPKLAVSADGQAYEVVETALPAEKTIAMPPVHPDEEPSPAEAPAQPQAQKTYVEPEVEPPSSSAVQEAHVEHEPVTAVETPPERDGLAATPIWDDEGRDAQSTAPEPSTGIVTQDQAIIAEAIRKQVVDEYEKRLADQELKYNHRLAALARDGRRQRTVAVAGACPAAMTAEAALEAASFAEAACPGCKATAFEHDGAKLASLEPFGAKAPDPVEQLFPDVAVHDFGADLGAAAAMGADALLIVLAPMPWEAQAQKQSLEAHAGALGGLAGKASYCLPVRGRRAGEIMAALGAGGGMLNLPNPNHFAFDDPRPADDFSQAMGGMMAKLAEEMGVEPQQPRKKQRDRKKDNQRSQAGSAKAEPEPSAAPKQDERPTPYELKVRENEVAVKEFAESLEAGAAAEPSPSAARDVASAEGEAAQGEPKEFELPQVSGSKDGPRAEGQRAEETVENDGAPKEKPKLMPMRSGAE